MRVYVLTANYFDSQDPAFDVTEVVGVFATPDAAKQRAEGVAKWKYEPPPAERILIGHPDGCRSLTTVGHGLGVFHGEAGDTIYRIEEHAVQEHAETVLSAT